MGPACLFLARRIPSAWKHSMSVSQADSARTSSQSIRLLSDSTVKFGKVGFESTVGEVDIPSLPGTFRSSNPAYDMIWSLGTRGLDLLL
ncbi:hypothetical protein BJX68DRAFT_226113 [Aspergillus pseudodeflectus]|uniref:Uncharacterized protein n=1 Tax=Aspergillus pseudodeflectus TaxID=176178 RepID=A0ABR4L420_9EURO